MRLFFREQKGYIFTYLLSVVLTIVYASTMKFISLHEGFYIVLFNTFILLCFFAFKYYQNRPLYALLQEGIRELNEVSLELGSSVLSQEIATLLKMQHHLYKAELQKGKKLHEEHLRFIHQWIHQMKTPLSVIQLQLQEEEGEENIEGLQEEVNKLKQGLNMAMHFARLDSFQKDFLVEKIALRKLALETVNEEKRMFIKNNLIPKVEIEEGTEVYSDKKWLKFLLGQLLINAIKYSSGKGKKVTIKVSEEGKEIILSVIDEGVGIPQKDIKRVFDPFFTGENGRRFGESTGMGLYITKEVCKQLGHEVELESTIQKGTVARIKFKKEM